MGFLWYNKGKKRGKKGREMTQEKFLWFDLDGTVYPLYTLPDWLPRLRAGDWTVYAEPITRRGLEGLRAVVRDLQKQGWKIGVATWLSMGLKAGISAENAARAKYNWLETHFPELLSDGLFLPMFYGENKGMRVKACVPHGLHYLVDDNAEVRKAWREIFGKGTALDAKRALPCQLRRMEAAA